MSRYETFFIYGCHLGFMQIKRVSHGSSVSTIYGMFVHTFTNILVKKLFGNDLLPEIAKNLLTSPNYKQYTANPSSGSDSFQQPVNSTQSMQSNSEKSAPFCNYCKRRGHLRSECFYLIGNQPSTHDVQQPSPSGHIVPMQLVSDPHSAAVIPCETGLATSNSDRIMEMFEPFIQNGFVLLSDDFSEAKPIRILRDTGSAQSMLLESTLPLSDSTYSGDNVLLKGVDTSLGTYPSAPLHQVYISSSHVNGPVTVGITSLLPIDGIDFLLGNDLAGGKVVANSLVTDMPCNNNNNNKCSVSSANSMIRRS